MDLSKVKTSLDKRDIATSLSTPDVWLSTGNMALNRLLSNSFSVGVPNRRSTMFFGPSGTGKSLLLSKIAVNAQKAGYMVVYIDTEHAIDESYMKRVGMNMDDDWFLPVRVSTIEEVSAIMSDLFRDTIPEDKVFVAMDSLSMLETQQEVEKFDKSGELQNDQGRTAKRLKALVKNINAKIGGRDMFFVYTAHAYANQDLTNGKGKWIISGGEGQLYIPSMSLLLEKLKLKDDSGNSTGFTMKAEIYKSRFSKLGSKCRLDVPFDEGIDPYDGVLFILVEEGMVNKNGAWYNYEHNGETIKFQKKNANKHIDCILGIE